MTLFPVPMRDRDGALCDGDGDCFRGTTPLLVPVFSGVEVILARLSLAARVLVGEALDATIVSIILAMSALLALLVLLRLRLRLAVAVWDPSLAGGGLVLLLKSDESGFWL